MCQCSFTANDVSLTWKIVFNTNVKYICTSGKNVWLVNLPNSSTIGRRYSIIGPWILWFSNANISSWYNPFRRVLWWHEMKQEMWNTTMCYSYSSRLCSSCSDKSTINQNEVFLFREVYGYFSTKFLSVWFTAERQTFRIVSYWHDCNDLQKLTASAVQSFALFFFTKITWVGILRKQKSLSFMHKRRFGANTDVRVSYLLGSWVPSWVFPLGLHVTIKL